MATLRAMLAAQAKESAAGEAHQKALEEKEDQIKELERRIADIEKELAEAKEKVTKLEVELQTQKTVSSKDKEKIMQLQRRQSVRALDAPDSPRSHRRRPSGEDTGHRRRPSGEGLPANYVSPEILNEHRAKVAILEDELESERQLRREADGEIIKLRAAMNGVKLDEEMVNDLLAPQVDVTRSEESSLASEGPPKTRYMLFIIVVLLLVLVCAALVVRRRTSARILLHLLDETKGDWVDHAVMGTLLETRVCAIDNLLGQFLALSGNHF